MRSPCPKRFRILDFDTRLHYFSPLNCLNPQTTHPFLTPVTPPPPPPSKRVLWIDVSRVIAALLIMYVHLSSPFLQAVSLHLFYLGRVPFFLVLAGYFLGRNITWNKAFNRAFWLFIPFMFWNVLYVFLVLPHDGASFRLENLIGIRDVFLPSMNLFSADDSHAVPPIGPSWFLRDIIILTLLTPLLVRVKILLFPAVLLFFCFFNTAPDHTETISIGTCAFYLLGVALSSRRIDDIHLLMNKKFGIFFWVSIFMPVVLIALYSAGVIPLWKETAIGMLLGVMMIMYAGIWMEKHLPGLSAKIALLAPACFLTFMLHWPIYGFLPPAMKSSLFAFFTPLLVFAAIVLFYFALKRFAPFLLPYLAHVKNTGRRQAQHGACDETIPLIRGLSGMSQSSERDAGNPMPGTRESF